MTAAPDLLSLTISLRPQPVEDPTAALPAWWGRAAHALLLHAVRQYDPTLANSLHASGAEADPAGSSSEAQNTIRPFSVSSLMGRFPNGVLVPDSVYSLRLTSLRSDLSAILLQAVQDGPLAPGRIIELDYMKFETLSSYPISLCSPGTSLESTDVYQGKGWAAAASYAELSAALLLSKQPAPRRVGLEFTSPTTFKSGGKHLPVPLPELVFGSLLERWNAFAPIAFPPETRRYAQECLALSRYQLATRPVSLKGGAVRVGALGKAWYSTINYDRYWMSLVGVLAAFSLFAGVGAGTGMGLGQCRSIPPGVEKNLLPNER